MSIYLLCVLLLIELIVILLYHFFWRNKKREKQYVVRAHFAGGKRLRLVLNQEQHDTLAQWMQQPNDVLTIGDDKNKVMLDRSHVAAVEVRMR